MWRSFRSDERTSPTLTDEQQVVAKRLLDYVRAEIENFAQGDADAAFRIRRWGHARLQLDNRPPRALQKRKFDQQKGICPECNRAFTELLGLPLHRVGPATTRWRTPFLFTGNAT